jgi:hypothetical protein
MGSGYQLTCQHCGYQQSITLGIGMAYDSPEALLDLVPRSMRAEVQAALTAHPEGAVEYRHALYRCTGCGCRDGRFYYHLDCGGGRTLEPAYHCRHCHADLVRERDNLSPDTPGAASTWPCPRCHHTGLQYGLALLWD